MKDSKTARGEGSLNLSMNKRTHRLWRKTSLVLSLRQFREAQNAGPHLNALHRTAYTPAFLCCPPSTQSSRSAPQLSVLQPAPPSECRVLTLEVLTLPGCSRLKCSPFPHPTREDTRLHSFPLFGILVCRRLTYPYSSSNPLSKPPRSTPTSRWCHQKCPECPDASSLTEILKWGKQEASHTTAVVTY